MKLISTIRVMVFACLLSTQLKGQDDCLNSPGFPYFNKNYDVLIDVFVEDFNGTALDLNKWSFDYPWGRTIPETKFLTEPSLVEVSNGTLKLYVIETPNVHYDEPIWDENENIIGYTAFNVNHSAGTIHTKRDFSLGKFEIKFRIDDEVNGIFPAFWFRSGPFEIDMLEFYRDEKQSIEKATMYARFGCLWTNEITDEDCKQRKNPMTSFDPLNWNELGMLWEHNRLTWYINGGLEYYIFRYVTLISQELNNPPVGGSGYYEKSSFPYANRDGYRLILNNGVRDPYHVNISTTPKTLEIDWVKVKKALDCSELVTFSNLVKQDQMYDGYVVAGRVEIPNGSNVNVLNGEYLDVYAAEYVEVGSDFNVENGAELEITVQPYCIGVFKSEGIYEKDISKKESGKNFELIEFNYESVVKGSFTVVTNKKLQRITFHDISSMFSISLNPVNCYSTNDIYISEFVLSNLPKGLLIINFISDEGELITEKINFL